MNLQEIAIFKRFIGQHDLRKNFIKRYHNSIGMTRNPESIEKYLSNVEPENVIVSAVKRFITNEAMGFDFWQSVNETWKGYLAKMRSSHVIEYEEASMLRGYFSALRENWDKEKPWVYEPIPVAQIRYGLITPEEAGLNNDDEAEDKPDNQHEDTPCQLPADSMPDVDDVDFEEDALDIQFVEFNAQRRVNKLERGFLSVNTRRSGRVTVNRVDTKVIRKKNIAYAMLGKTAKGDVMLQFCNNSKGIPCVYNVDDYLNVNSNQFCASFKRLLDVTDDLVYFRMELVSEKLDSITYKITKQQ